MNADREYGSCRSCKRMVRWAPSAATGKPMPLDSDDERGNVVLDERGRAHVFKDHAAALAAIDEREDLALEQSGNTYISHHAEGQCPQGRQWQGKTRQDPDAPAPPPEPVQESLL